MFMALAKRRLSTFLNGQERIGTLRVIYVPDPEPNSVFVITACDLAGKALEGYRKRRSSNEQIKIS
jgi:hypothetical protein